MNVVRLAVLGAAVLAAGGAFFLMRSQSAQPQAAAVGGPVAPEPEAMVLVARKPLAVGERLTPDALAWQAWPKAGVAEAFFEQSVAPKAIEEWTNAVVRYPMVQGEPLTAAKLAKAGDASVMAALLTPGMRAVSVPISVATGAGGFILPNDRVDIVLTRDMQVADGQSTRQRTVSDVVIENVRVLAVDQTFAEAAETRTVVGSTALLELSAADVATLQVADKLGDISLTLRSLADTAGPTVARADIDAMRQAAAVAAAPTPAAPAAGPAAPAPAPAVRVYRGGGSAAS